MDNILFVGDYVDYYEILTANNLSASENIKLCVDEVKQQIEQINSLAVDWNGEAHSSYVEAIKCMMASFSDIKSKIDEKIVPACEAADKLVPKLETFKKIDEETYNLKKSYDNLGYQSSKTKNPDYDPNDPDSEEYIANTKYQNWVDAKNKYETKKKEDEQIQKECDELIKEIKELQDQIDNFNQSITNALGENGIEFVGKDFNDMTYEEKKKFVDKLVENYKSLYDQLQTYFKDHFGDGLPFDYEMLVTMNVFFETFGAFDYYGDDARCDFLTEPSKFAQYLEYLEKNKILEKIHNYIDGDSWEESGLAEVYQNRYSWYRGTGGGFGELDILDKINSWIMSDSDLDYVGLSREDYEYLQNLYGPGNEENTTNFLRQYLKKNIDRFEGTYEAAKVVYSDYVNTITSITTVKELYQEAVRTQYLLPCMERTKDPAYAKFYEEFMKDPSKYSGLEGKYLYEGLAKYNKTFNDYMSDSEKALYYYLKQSDPKLAEQFLNGIHNELNKAYAQDVAKDFLKDAAGKGCIDLFASTFIDGGADGIEGFIGGCKAWFNGDNTLLGDHTALDYVQQYKTAYLIGNLQNMTAEERAEFQAYIDQLGGTKGAIAKEFYTTGNTVGYMAIPMTLALATQGLGSFGAFGMTPAVAEGFAQWGSSALLGFSAGGNAKDAALSMGASVEDARGYGFATAFLETITEAGTAQFFNFGGMIPGMKVTQGGATTALKDVFSSSGVKGVAQEIFKRATPALKDILGEGVQEVFQTGVENLLYDAAYADGIFDTVLNDPKNVTEGMAEAFWEAIKATGAVRGSYGAMNMALNPNVNSFINSYLDTKANTAPAAQTNTGGTGGGPTGTPTGLNNNTNTTLNNNTGTNNAVLEQQLADAQAAQAAAQTELDAATSAVEGAANLNSEAADALNNQKGNVENATGALEDAQAKAYEAYNEQFVAEDEAEFQSDMVNEALDEAYQQRLKAADAEAAAADARTASRKASKRASDFRGSLSQLGEDIHSDFDAVNDAKSNLAQAKENADAAKSVVELSNEELRAAYEERNQTKAELKDARAELRDLEKQNGKGTAGTNETVETASAVGGEAQAASGTLSGEEGGPGKQGKAGTPSIEEMGGPFDPEAFNKYGNSIDGLTELENDPTLRKHLLGQNYDTAKLGSAYLDGDNIIVDSLNGQRNSFSRNHRTFHLKQGGNVQTSTSTQVGGTDSKVQQTATGTPAVQTEGVQTETNPANSPATQQNTSGTTEGQSVFEKAASELESKIEGLKGQQEQQNAAVQEKKAGVEQAKADSATAQQGVKNATDILNDAETKLDSDIQKYHDGETKLAELDDIKNDAHEELLDKNREVRQEQKTSAKLDSEVDQEINKYNEASANVDATAQAATDTAAEMEKARDAFNQEQAKLDALQKDADQKAQNYNDAVNTQQDAQTKLDNAQQNTQAAQEALDNAKNNTNQDTRTNQNPYTRTWEDVMEEQSLIETAEGTLGYDYDTVVNTDIDTNTNLDTDTNTDTNTNLDTDTNTDTNTNLDTDVVVDPNYVIHPYVDLPDIDENDGNLYMPPINPVPQTTPKTTPETILDTIPETIPNPTPPNPPGPGPQGSIPTDSQDPIITPDPEPEVAPTIPLTTPYIEPTPDPGIRHVDSYNNNPSSPHTGLDETYESKGNGFGGLAAAAGILAGVGGLAATAVAMNKKKEEDDEEENKEQNEQNYYYNYDLDNQAHSYQNNSNYNYNNNYNNNGNNYNYNGYDNYQNHNNIYGNYQNNNFNDNK